MDGLARPIGAGIPIKFGGNTYILNPLTMGDFGIIEQHLLALRRKTMIDVAALTYANETLPLEFREKLAREAVEGANKLRAIPADDVKEWINTIDGITFCIWLSFQKSPHAKDFPLERCVDVMAHIATSDDGEEQIEMLRAARDQAGVLDSAGNSIGPTPQNNGSGQTARSSTEKYVD